MKWLVLLIAYLLLTTHFLSAQENADSRGPIRIMFYNVENYFDTYDDSLTNDAEFLPEGDKQWDDYRFYKKTRQLFKVIAAVGEGEPPEIIALAEIENRFVLEQLANNTYLNKYPFEIVHYDSPDRRGIDVALLYRSDKLRLLNSKNIAINFPDNPRKLTRDILYSQLVTNTSDSLHLFINHWPSRMGGKVKSEPGRVHVASVLRNRVDSIFQNNPCANIIITGDFNDEPHDKSITQSLHALQPDGVNCGKLYNLSASLQQSCKCGTYRYKASWNMLDQFIVSGALLHSDNRINTCKECLHIARFDFLLQKDEKYAGQKPYRTYLGPVYKGGFSDHLPIYLDLFQQ